MLIYLSSLGKMNKSCGIQNCVCLCKHILFNDYIVLIYNDICLNLLKSHYSI